MSQPCQIVNNTGSTIWLKIVGHKPNVQWHPDLQGPSNGILFAAAPLNQIQAMLNEGRRVAIAWDSSGSFIIANNDFDVTAPGTLLVANGSMSYSEP